MAESERGRSYYSGSGSRLFRDENLDLDVMSPSSMSLGLDHNMKSHRQYKYDDDYDDDEDEGASLLSFQKVKDERDYDIRTYTRKRSNNSMTKSLVRTSSPDRGGGGGGGRRRGHDDNDHAYNDDKRHSKVYHNDDMRQSLSRQSRSHESSSISYIDYNDSFHENKRNSFHENKKSSNSRHKFSNGQSRSQSPSVTSDRRLGTTVRTDLHADSVAASSITFDYYAYNQSQSQYRRQKRQPFVGHDGKLAEHTEYRTDDDYSTMSKPQVPFNITVPSPNKFDRKTSLNTHDHNYSGKELKKPPYSSSVKVHEMGSRRQALNRRSSSKSRASSRNMDRKGSRSSSASKRSRSSSSKSTHSRHSKGSSKSGSRRSKGSSKNGSGKSRSGNSSDSKHRSRRRDQRSVKSGTSEKERRQRDRRREMMTGKATKHLLEDDKSSYSRSSVRYDVDDEGYCQHHPEIELMRLRSDGFWSTVRKKCPECIYEDCPSLMGDEDEDCAHESAPESNDITAEARAILRSSRLFSFHDIVSPEDIEKEEELRRLKRRLAARAYHFPGNSWWQDWMQYLSNTHTVLGLFFHQ